MFVDTSTSFNKTKFEWRKPSIDRKSVDMFTNTSSAWSKGHHYRTSYTDMSQDGPNANKSYVIPKY